MTYRIEKKNSCIHICEPEPTITLAKMAGMTVTELPIPEAMRSKRNFFCRQNCNQDTRKKLLGDWYDYQPCRFARADITLVTDHFLRTYIISYCYQLTH